MTNPQAVALLSDHHLSLGANWNLEDFKSDAQMGHLVDFLGRRFVGKRLDLVLLGDVFDLLQVVPESDFTAGDSSQISLELDLAQLHQDLAAIANNHRPFFQALGRFSQDLNNRLVILAGNHDHPLVDTRLQAALKDILVRGFNFTDRGNNLVFPRHHFYDAPHLGLYAEHGNQYDKFNSYADFGRFGPDPRADECQGYGFMRLFLNRVEYLHPDIEDTPEHWSGWFNWVMRYVLSLRTLFKTWCWFQEYLGESRVEPISLLDFGAEAALAVPSDTGEEHQIQPANLLDGQNLNRNLLFSEDPVVESAYRRFYHENEEFREEIDRILARKFPPGAAPPVTLMPMPGSPSLDLGAEVKVIHPAAGAAQSLVLGEPQVRNLKPMFSPGQGPNLFRDAAGNPAYLDSRVYHLVVLGHTHDPRWMPMPDYPEKLYVNTGSWTTRRVNGGTKTERTVVLVEERDNGGNQEVWVEGGEIDDAGNYRTMNAGQRLPLT